MFFDTETMLPKFNEDNTPTERRIPIEEEKEQFTLAIQELGDLSLTAGACFQEMVEVAAPKDKVLSQLCDDARRACDKVTSYIIDRSI